MNETIWTSEKIKKAALGALILLAVFLGARSITEILKWDSVGDEAPLNTITVTGRGEEFQVADVATFSFAVNEEAKSVSEAQKKATDKANAAIKYLKDEGIEDKDIKTSNYSAGPKREYRPCTAFSCPVNGIIVGYEVNQTIMVKVRDIEKAGTLLTGIVATGATNVSDLNFVIDDEEEVKEKAREKAIEDAKEKAKTLAKKLDVDLEEITSYFENNDPIFYGREMNSSKDMAMGGAMQSNTAPSLPAGENKVVVNISVTYRIK